MAIPWWNWLVLLAILFAVTLTWANNISVDMSLAPAILKGGLIPRSILTAFNSASIRRVPPFSYVVSSPFKSVNSHYHHHTIAAMSSKTAIPHPESAVTVTSATAFLESIQNRRSFYVLNKESPIPNSRIQEIIEHALLHVPSSFNSQPVRIVLLLGAEHTKLWGTIVKDALRAVVPAENFPTTEQKIEGFNAAYGTVLFFDDRTVTQTYQENFKIYADKFPQWALESGGMHQFAVWTALEAEGLGANLQHYDPLIDAEVQSTWNVPESWVLRSQLVFGGIKAGAKDKSYKAIEGERLIVHGA